MSKYNLNGNNVENSLVIDNTASGISINGGSLFNFPNKYKAKIGSSKYSYTNINYKINDVDQGTLLSPKIKVFNTANSTTYTLQTNTRKILCICQGGGAGGTGGNYTSGGGESGGAGSGGGGGGLAWVLYKVTGGETLTIVVGGGGNGGSAGDPFGIIGTKGGNSSVTINSINICQGEGGAPGVAETADRNYGSICGPTVSGTYVSNSNTLDGGTRSGLSGGDGQNDPENGFSSNFGDSGAGGNGGTTVYTYGMGTRPSNASDPTLTIGPLQFDNVNFLNSDITLDTSVTFTYADFTGTNSVGAYNQNNYGRGARGGFGEGRNNGSATNGSNGNIGFVVIAEYGA